MLNGEQRIKIQKLYRIPVDAHVPGVYWIICLDGDSAMPTPEELVQLLSYREFLVLRLYREYHAKQILSMPLPYDSGHNTTIFLKNSPLNPEHKGWFYRKLTWREGPIYWPVWNAPSMSLAQVLDKIEDVIPEK